MRGLQLVGGAYKYVGGTLQFIGGPYKYVGGVLQLVGGSYRYVGGIVLTNIYCRMTSYLFDRLFP